MFRIPSQAVLAVSGAVTSIIIFGMAPALADPWSEAPRQRDYVYQPSPYASSTPYSSGTPYYPSAWQQVQQRQRDCNRGRLIGGIVGGGLGYVASRDDGRSWAVPLGALLGSQVGCSTGSGRGPLPW
ncbi:MAG: hypothetical protein CMN96_04880 [Synechococcus sp. MED850]|nr:hypothetical protein [Synechococcus sp. MED850]OUW98178.1 MAG: hypothetical protein CBD89_03600 [Cyanobacteria bacterium TMED229]